MINKKGDSTFGTIFSGFSYKEKSGEITTYLNVDSEFEKGKFKLEDKQVLFHGYHEEGFKKKLYECPEGNNFTWRKVEYKRLTTNEIEELIKGKVFLYRSPIDEAFSIKRAEIDSW